MRTAAEFIPGATSGNRTSIDIEARPEEVWEAMQRVEMRDMRLTGALMGVRSVPALVKRRRRPSPNDHRAPTTLLDAMSGRFVTLAAVENEILTLGVIGQFWKLSGGVDVAITDATEFVEFDEPGYVKAAIDFLVESTSTGTRLSTSTDNAATDQDTAKKFGRYWRIIGPGSKIIRIDMLRAVRKRAAG